MQVAAEILTKRSINYYSSRIRTSTFPTYIQPLIHTLVGRTYYKYSEHALRSSKSRSSIHVLQLQNDTLQWSYCHRPSHSSVITQGEIIGVGKDNVLD